MNYQKLFDYMSKEHGVDLLETDMQEIENIVKECSLISSKLANREYFERVLCSEELPTEDGEYIAFSKCNTDTNSAYAYADTLAFKNGVFKEITNWTTLWWLKPVSLDEVKADALIQSYEDGREHEEKTIVKYIQDWKGETNSGLGQLLADKLTQIKQ
jgi:hypothetical protein